MGNKTIEKEVTIFYKEDGKERSKDITIKHTDVDITHDGVLDEDSIKGDKEE